LIHECTKLLNSIKSGPVEIGPYNKRSEITVRIQQYLDDIEGGVFLRLYLPNGRYQADQIAELLRLFENYLQSIEKLQFRIDARKSDNGVMYVFRSKDEVNDLTNIKEAFVRFESFMRLCQNDPDRAISALLRMGASSIDAPSIVAKYATRFNRLIIDTHQEFERRCLSLKHQFQNEIFEASNGLILRFSNSDPSANLMSLVPLPSNTLHNNLAHKEPSDLYLASLEARIERGDISYTEEDLKIRDLLSEYKPEMEATSLHAELDQLKDESAPEEERQSAKQKLLGALHKISQVTRDETIKQSIIKLLHYLGEQYAKHTNFPPF
jgi:hypothetical protein